MPAFFADEEEVRAVPQRRRDAASRAGGENNVVLIQTSRGQVKKDIRRPPGYASLLVGCRSTVPLVLQRIDLRLDDCQAPQEFVEIMALSAAGNDKRNVV